MRARAQNMCFMTIEGIDRMNVLERDVCSILDLGEFSTTRFVRSAGGKAPVMIDMQLRAGEAASGQMPRARAVEHLERNLETSVVVGGAPRCPLERCREHCDRATRGAARLDPGSSVVLWETDLRN